MCISFFFFFNDTATTEIYTLSLHDALPISDGKRSVGGHPRRTRSAASTMARSFASATLAELTGVSAKVAKPQSGVSSRSEEHTSELQSRLHLVCRLLLEKKKKRSQERPHPS